MAAIPDAPALSIGKDFPRLLFCTLMLGHWAQGMAYTAFVSVLPQMARDLGNNGAFVAQMSMSMAALGAMVGSLASGWVLEKAGTRMSLISAISLYGLSGAGGLVLHDPMLMLASRFAVGVASACMVTVCMWGIAAEYEGQRRAQVIGIACAFSSFAALVANLAGGSLARLGGWRLAFLQYPVFGLCGLLLAWPSVKQVYPKRERPDKPSQPYFKQLLPFYLAATCLLAVMFMGSAQFPFLLAEQGMANPTTRSLVLAAITVVGTVASFLYGPLVRRAGALGAFTLALFCMAAGLVAVCWGMNPAWAILGASLMGIYVGIVGPYVYHEVTERSDDVSRSHAIGLLNAFFLFGGFLNPFMFEPLSKAIGLRNVFLLVGFVMAAAAVGTLARLIRRTAHLETQA
jgi:MFS family permease